MLAKHTEGKKINMDKMDKWIVLQFFIAGLRSNPNCCNVLALRLGICYKKNRNEKKEKLNKRKDYLKIIQL